MFLAMMSAAHNAPGGSVLFDSGRAGSVAIEFARISRGDLRLFPCPGTNRRLRETRQSGIRRFDPSVRGLIIAQLSGQDGVVQALAREGNTQDRQTLGAHMEANRIQFAPGRQMHALRIAQVAPRAQGLVVAGLLPRAGSAATFEAVAQRKKVALRPEFSRVRHGWDEVGASHAATSLKSPF